MPGRLAHTYYTGSIDHRSGRDPLEITGSIYNTGSWTDPIEAELKALPSDYSSRGFWVVQMTTIPTRGPLGATTRQMADRFMLAVVIRETSPFHYRGMILMPTVGSVPWADLQKFVAVAIMPNSGYAAGALPLAGFWHPDGAADTHYVKQWFPEWLQYAPMVVPFVFPNEPRYVRLIAQV
jgi:hypothetical protein